MSESTASDGTSAHAGSTPRRLRGGEAGEMHHGGSTKMCGCLVADRNPTHPPSFFSVRRLFRSPTWRPPLLHIMSGVSRSPQRMGTPDGRTIA